MVELHHPSEQTFFIAKNGVITYGVVEPNQCMDSGLPNLETFLDETIWAARLAELGIDPYASQEEEENV